MNLQIAKSIATSYNMDIPEFYLSPFLSSKVLGLDSNACTPEAMLTS